MKKGPKILLVIVCILVALIIFINPIGKFAIEAGGSAALGTKVKIGSFKLGLFSQKMRIKDFRILQPKGFEKGNMVSIPEISVDYDMGQLVLGKLHFPLMVLNLEEMVVIKNKEGVLNVDTLKVAQKPEGNQQQSKEKKKRKEVKMQIDKLVLTVGKVVSKNYQGVDKPVVQAFDVGIKDREYKNITSADQLAVLLMSSAMGPTAFKGAAIYGAAAVLGVALLPAGVAAVLISKDSVTEEFNVRMEDLFKIAVASINATGKIDSQDSANFSIKANIDGANVVVSIEKGETKTSKITISARKYMIPNKKVAEGLLYGIKNKIK